MPVQVPEAIANINRNAVINDKTYRQELLDIVDILDIRIANMEGMLFEIKEKMKDAEYQAFLEELYKLFKLRNKIKQTIIMQVIQHKHNIDRNAKEKPKTEEEKIKQGYIRCERCDKLLKNAFSLCQHRERNICREIFVIKETEGITSKPKGAKIFTKSKLKVKKNAFALFTSFNDYHKDWVNRFEFREHDEEYEGKLRDKMLREKEKNTSIENGETAEKIEYKHLRKYTTYKSWKFRNM